MVDGEFTPRINDATYPTVAYATDEWAGGASTRGMNPTANIKRPDGALSFLSCRDGVMVDGEFTPRINDATYPTVAYATDEWAGGASIRGMNPTATVKRPDGALSFFSRRDGVTVDGEFIPRINDATYPTVAYATDEWAGGASTRGMNPTATVKRPDGALQPSDFFVRFNTPPSYKLFLEIAPIPLR